MPLFLLLLLFITTISYSIISRQIDRFNWKPVPIALNGTPLINFGFGSFTPELETTGLPSIEKTLKPALGAVNLCETEFAAGVEVPSFSVLRIESRGGRRSGCGGASACTK